MSSNDSWWLKIARAQEHLKHFNEVVAKYAASSQHAVRKRDERQGKRVRVVHRLEIEQPDVGLLLPVILGDFLFNVRSALDHIIVASVPRKQRYKTQFPVFTENIWERDASGEYLKRHADSQRNWYRWTTGLSDDALTIVKGVQPFNSTTPDPSGYGVKNHVLAILSALQNADKHRELVVVGGFVEQHRTLVIHPSGEIGVLTDDVPPPLKQPFHILEDGAELAVSVAGIDPSTVQVKVEGPVEVLVGRAGSDSPVWRLNTLTDLTKFVVGRILNPLDDLLS